MIERAVHTDGDLQVETTESVLQIQIALRGASTARDPSKFLEPILQQVTERAVRAAKRLCIDFRGLSRMNSSTVSPILRLLTQARNGALHLELVYDRNQHWQKLSFAGLKAFTTLDGRIAVVAA